MALDTELLRKCIIKIAEKGNQTSDDNLYAEAAEFHKCPVFVTICSYMASLVGNAGVRGIEAACGTSLEMGFNAGREYERQLAGRDLGNSPYDPMAKTGMEN